MAAKGGRSDLGLEAARRPGACLHFPTATSWYQLNIDQIPN
jgi:hypothetical protein